jgi:carboxypeptidase Taq
MAYFSKLAHEKRTSKELQSIISFLHKKDNFEKLNKTDQLIVEKYDKKIKKWSKLPHSFVEEMSRLIPESHNAWEQAREKNNFKKFQPFLEKMVALKRKEAKLIDPSEHPYNVLLDDFEEGMTVEQLDEVFPKLRNGLIKLIDQIKSTEKYKQQKDVLGKKKFPIEQQKEIVTELKEMLFLDPAYSVQSIAVHPFMTRISPDDVRITTNYREGQPFFSFGSTAHESGHALYELGFDPKLMYTILYGAPSLAIHESQSRFWENQICRGKDFWNHYYSNYKKKFQDDLNDVSKEEFYSLMNQVKPSFIRIESDEVTYCMHVIIRYELERALLDGSLEVKDLPKAWNEKYTEYLGITPKKDSEGVLQDVHWSEGLIGYFPTYALGTMYSSMLYNKMKEEVPSIETNISKGDLKVVLDWLRKNVHVKGSTKLADEIVTEEGLTEKDYLEYLNEKYLEIYS